MAVFSYLYASRSGGMLHALPLRREGLFLTNLLSGLVMMAIPYAVTGVLTVLVTMLSGSFSRESAPVESMQLGFPSGRGSEEPH